MTHPGHPAFLELADDELMIGHVLTSVAGWGPELEANLALSSIGQDEMGHAEHWYARYEEGLEAQTRLIYERPAGDFRAAALTTIKSVEWDLLVLRGFIYDEAERVRLEALAGIDPVAARMEREEVFHRDFWRLWLDRTAGREGEPRARMQSTLARLWPLRGELVDRPGLAELLDTHELRERLDARLLPLLREAGLEPVDGDPARGDLDSILGEMRVVYQLAPGTSW